MTDVKGLPKVIRVGRVAARRWGGRTIVVPSPIEIDALMRTVPRGRVTTVNELRAAVARAHHAEAGCPITTGIFSWIAANAAEELAAAGAKRITPYWRTLKQRGQLNPKFPGGVSAQQRRLAAEGHQFVRKGTRVFVRDFEKVLARPV
jgi:hypothetical protein